MKFLFTALLVFCNTTLLFSQTIDIETSPEQQSYSGNTFTAGDGTITVSGNQFVLGSTQIANPEAWSLSSSNKKAAFLQRRNGTNLLSYNSEGTLLIEKNFEFFAPSDNTINAYQFGNGRVVLRDNVANFSFLNAKGDLGYSLSNSSGSSEGEKESELASDPSGNTIVVYNPVIVYGSEKGSRAQIVYGDRDNNVFFRSRNEEIKNIRISDDGAFITVLSAGNQGNRVNLFDRFGNELFEVASDEDLIGATLHEDAAHLTIYSSARVQVYEIPGGDRLGSASSRSSILFAGYDPESQTIIALGGTLNGFVIQDPEITAVSISQRKIAREEVPFSISTLNPDRLELSKSGTRYEISGLNRDLLVDISF